MMAAFGAMYVNNNYIDDKNPDHVLGLRVLYCVMQVLCLGMHLYIMNVANGSKSENVITVTEPMKDPTTMTEAVSYTLQIRQKICMYCHSTSFRIVIQL